MDNLYELYLYRQINKLARQDNIDVWGMLSWQWKRKLTGVPAQEILDCIEQNAGADVYIFNPYLWDEAVSFNVWEQGEWSHPGIVPMAQEILEAMGESPALVMQPMDRGLYLAANYFAGTGEFWDGMLTWLTKFETALEQVTDVTKQQMMSSAGYEPNNRLNYTGFLCERMISTYFVRNQKDLAICARAPSVGHLSDLKAMAVDNNDLELLKQWNTYRTPKGVNLATQWIEKLYS